MRKLLLLPLLLTTVACGPDEPEGPSFADTPLSGLVGGEEWTIQAGATDDFLSDDEHFFTTFFGEPVEDPCAAFGDPPKILTQLPTSPGDNYGFSLRTRTLTFVVLDENDEIDNLVSTSGFLRIDEVDEASGLISGAIQTSFDEDNDLNGTFEATICPGD
jgi:hypothetical protein